MAIAVATFIVAALSSYWTAAALIVRAAGTTGWAGALARWDARAVSDTLEQIPIRGGAMRARILRPTGPPARAALLVAGGSKGLSEVVTARGPGQSSGER